MSEYEDLTEQSNYKHRWWKLWWWLPDWQCYGFRYKWMRDFYDWLREGL